MRVNGITIGRDVIAREVQHHPARTPIDAWKAAAQALVVRELLLQEARRLDIFAEPTADSDGRREAADEAAIRALITREVKTLEPNEASCRHYYEYNIRRFRSPDIYEAAHILFAAAERDAQAYEQARTDAQAVLAQLQPRPDRFAELAQLHSDCPSAAQAGNLGQITSGQTTPEFERALVALAPGSFTREPVATRYGFHIIRLDRRIDGRELPYELVAEQIALYLKENVQRRATTQYIARLASQSTIEGAQIATPEVLRVF